MSNFFFYDDESCDFKPVEYPTLDKVVHTASLWALYGIVFGGLLIIGLSSLAGTPAEIALRAENKELLSQLKYTKSTIEELDSKISKLSETDNEIYREVLGIDPLSYDERLAGTGGADLYSKFDVFQSETAELMRWTASNLETLERRINIQIVSFEELKEFYNQNQEKMRHIPAIRPINSVIVSGYGMRMHPILRYRRMHEGIDFRAQIGTPIYATGDGVIVESTYRGTYGMMIKIDHGYGFETIYAHLSAYEKGIRPGKRVKRGEVIGLSGDSGQVEAPHLHYEILKNSRAVDPLFYLFADITPEEYLAFRKISDENDSSLD